MNIDMTKIANIILYMLHKQVKALNHKKIELLIFFCELNHLNFCGKKILGETFIKTSRGVKAEVLDELFTLILDEVVFEDEEDDRVFFIQELMDCEEIEIIEKERFKELKLSKLDVPPAVVSLKSCCLVCTASVFIRLGKSMFP